MKQRSKFILWSVDVQVLWHHCQSTAHKWKNLVLDSKFYSINSCTCLQAGTWQSQLLQLSGKFLNWEAQFSICPSLLRWWGSYSGFLWFLYQLGGRDFYKNWGIVVVSGACLLYKIWNYSRHRSLSLFRNILYWIHWGGKINSKCGQNHPTG